MKVDLWADALAWHARIREGNEKELSFAVARQWQEWYADAENRKIFDDLCRLLADCDVYRERSRPSPTELEEDRYDLSVPIAEWRRVRARCGTWRRRCPIALKSVWWPSSGLGVAAIILLLVLQPLWLWSGADQAAPTIYQTQVGGIKDVHLSDGSSIILGGRTRVSVALLPRRRSVSLIRGQAWFRVAHDPGRPFVVSAGDGTITDVGTAFLVTRESDRVIVTVTQGTVQVLARPTWLPSGIIARISPMAQLPTISLSRGEEVTFGDNGVMSRVTATDGHAATTWIHGRLTFDDQPLQYVVETVNRYSVRHITASAAADSLRFTGIVSANDIAEWLQSLELIFPVAIQDRGSSLRIEMRDSPSAARDSTIRIQP